MIRSIYVADANGRRSNKYLMYCEKRHFVEVKLIKCLAGKKKCTTLKRNYKAKNKWIVYK